jgi:hypothetical protein
MRIPKIWGWRHSELAQISAVLPQSPLWEKAKKEAGQPRVLLATSAGGHNICVTLEGALGVALTLRGAAVDFLLCDGLPACMLTKIGKESPEQVAGSDTRKRCDSCMKAGRSAYDPLGLDVLMLGRFLTEQDRREAQAFAKNVSFSSLRQSMLNGWNVGQHALAGALRYFARGDLVSEPMGEAVARQFTKAAVLAARAIDHLLRERHYDVICFNHGIYVPQGVIGEVARSRGIRVVNWNPAYRRQCFIFSHGDTYHHTMISEDVAEWEGLELTQQRRNEVLSYLRHRRQGKGDWIWFNNSGDVSMDEIACELQLDRTKPFIVALTSVVWDACLHYESNAFESMADWIVQTIRYFDTRSDLQLVVRVHPAEVTGLIQSRDKMADIIQHAFPRLPGNVRVVPPENNLSTYSLIDNANAVLIYSTKTGIEASAAGAPVIVAGEAWVRNKGFTRDATCPESYRRILDELPFGSRLDEKSRDRALRYAHHFFFQRMIELPFIKETSDKQLTTEIHDLSELGPKRFAGLDCVCDGILNGTPFVFRG